MSPTDIALPLAGTYDVSWQVSVAEAGQLVIGLDVGSGPVEQLPTTAGRATGTSLITNRVLITTAAPSVLTVRNPAGNSTALTITPLAGGALSASAWLTIVKLT